MDEQAWFTVLGIGTVLAPVLLMVTIGVTALAGKTLGENATARLTQAAVVVGLLAALGVSVLMLLTGRRLVPIELGQWVVVPEADFHFQIQLVFDRLSVAFAILSYVLVGVVGAFASHYLHREPGYHRFFLLYAMFLVGMVVSAVAGTIETLFFGWELVGLSSALLVAYFHERPAPVMNGQRVWTVYRVADAMFLVAAVVLHHWTGEGSFIEMMGAGPWPEGQAALTSAQALLVGLLLLFAAAGKSALVPFSGWLPRAMEGPTPSSAIFYGALSVHLGAFLLLRVSPLLDASQSLSIAVALLGGVTAVYAALTARVQTDIKSALAFASLTQVGIITVEIGVGLRVIPLIHIVGHAILRTLQLLRAPTLLHDYSALENAIGEHLPPANDPLGRLVPGRWQLRLYRMSLERGYLDSLLGEYIVRPFLAVFRWCDRMERRWTDFVSQTDSRESEQIGPSAPVEEAI
jgi:NAD(P)H-quinone oxidoreductase subunit 5